MANCVFEYHPILGYHASQLCSFSEREEGSRMQLIGYTGVGILVKEILIIGVKLIIIVRIKIQSVFMTSVQ